MRHFLLFFIFILIFVTTLLMWIGNSRISDFESGHVSIATETTASVNEAIMRFISERRRFVSVFTETHHKLLSEIVSSPDDDALHDALIEKLELFFPNYFAYSLVDKSGAPLFEDFDGLLGAQCTEDLKHFSKTKKHLPKVHPNSEMYHFDIMVPFKVNENNYTFFLSFNADLLANILNNSTVPDHELILILPLEKRKLIEATSEGSRIHLDRNDFRMTSEEESRVLRSKRIEGTSWQILDLQRTGLFETFKRKIYFVNGIIFFVFMCVIFLWLRNVRKVEKIRLEADQHKSEFLSTVSHELRTPLTAIKGSIGLLASNMNNDLSEQNIKLSDIALSNTNRLINIVNDLLDMQKIEAGKLALDLKKENLTELIKQSLDSIEDYGKQFGVSYQFRDSLPNTSVMVDANRFVQVMSNLLSNAAKYGKHNDTVEVSITPYQNLIRVSVSDNGEGIDASFQDKIFSKYSQASDTMKNKTRVESTGLGLHIVKQLVNQMNADINFNSSKQGTTFYIDLKID